MIVNEMPELSLGELESEDLSELPTRNALSGLGSDLTIIVAPQVAIAIAIAPLGGSVSANAGNLLQIHHHRPL